jgi:hypothetical protein
MAFFSENEKETARTSIGYAFLFFNPCRLCFSYKNASLHLHISVRGEQIKWQNNFNPQKNERRHSEKDLVHGIKKVKIKQKQYGQLSYKVICDTSL